MNQTKQDQGSSQHASHATRATGDAGSMPDMQKSHDDRNIAIDKVGVKDIRYPIVVMDKNKEQQQTVARINMYVDLPHHFKGTHMSRFIEILNQYHGEISIERMDTMLRNLKEYQCRMVGSLDEDYDFMLGVTVPMTSLCPCSKEISARGAHNQRSAVTVEIRYTDHIWLEDLITWIEACGSAPVFALLKREDEKALTEQAYDNPMFVEDVVRAVTQRLLEIPEITWFRVACENFESIHNHSAYAMVERPMSEKRG